MFLSEFWYYFHSAYNYEWINIMNRLCVLLFKCHYKTSQLKMLRRRLEFPLQVIGFVISFDAGDFINA